jgi:lysine-N-methylase
VARGRPVVEHIDELRKLLPSNFDRLQSRPPAIIAGHRRDWVDTRRVTDVLERMMCDVRYPMVRRIVHVLEVCDLLADCKPRKLHAIASADFAELVRVAGESACETAGEWFRERLSPARGAATAFRQAAGETLRLHHGVPSRPRWSERLRMLRTVLAITRGKGRTPPLVPDFLRRDFADLERPLGALDLEMIRPLDDYFQTLTASLRYCTLAYRGWSVVEGVRALALQYPIALWAWRWACGSELSSEKLIPIIGCLDRAHTVSALTGWRHRRRCDVLAVNGQLQRLVAWYAR